VAYANRAYVYWFKKDFDRAIADCNQAIKLDPYFSQAYFHRGIAYLGKLNLTQGQADLRKALQLDPNNENARDALNVLAKMGY
jgi:tetratricopeptide (TPR) repeat protein